MSDPHQDMVDDPDYQAWVEQAADECRCYPLHMRPCDPLLAGGPCECIDWEAEHE